MALIPTTPKRFQKLQPNWSLATCAESCPEGNFFTSKWVELFVVKPYLREKITLCVHNSVFAITVTRFFRYLVNKNLRRRPFSRYSGEFWYLGFRYLIPLLTPFLEYSKITCISIFCSIYTLCTGLKWKLTAVIVAKSVNQSGIWRPTEELNIQLPRVTIAAGAFIMLDT